MVDRRTERTQHRRVAELVLIAYRNVEVRFAGTSDLLKAADRFRPRARKITSDAFARAKDKIPQVALQLALKSGDVERVESIIEGALREFDRAFRKPFTKVLTKVQSTAGTSEAEQLSSKRVLSGTGVVVDESSGATGNLEKDLLNDTPDETTVLEGHPRMAAPKIKGFAFDKTNPRAKEWVDEHVGELIDDMSRATRERVKGLVERTVGGEFDTHDLADRITELIGDESRAETIARTETMAASNGGQREAWAQAVDDGLLNGDEEEEWITTPDDITCPICQPMDGVRKPLNGQFNVDGEMMDGPPAHPRCRCTTALAVKGQ